MKQLLLLLFFCSAIAAAQPGVEIRLVSSNVGYSLYDPLSGVSSNQSNDPGLNAIFLSNGVTSYYMKSHPDPAFEFRIGQVTLPPANVAQFIADVSAYSSVVEFALPCDFGTLSNVLEAQLADAAVGIPTGSSNNIILTNDAGLNAVLTQYNVYMMNQLYPSSQNESSLRWYVLACDCDAQQLRLALEAYTSVISGTELYGWAMLGVADSTFMKASVYPNPFSDRFEIHSPLNGVIGYSMADITGKRFIAVSDADSLQSQLPNLQSGVYILTVVKADGNKSTVKVIKK